MKLFLSAVVFFLISFSLLAQSDANKGQITGTVFDQKQAVIPNAKITVRNTATGATRELISGAEGQFRVVLLDPGTYDVSVSAPAVRDCGISGRGAERRLRSQSAGDARRWEPPRRRCKSRRN